MSNTTSLSAILVFPNCTERQVYAPFAATDTPALPGVPFGEVEVPATAFGYLQAGSALLTAIFTVSCCLQLRNTLSLDGQILGIRTIFNGLER